MVPTFRNAIWRFGKVENTWFRPFYCKFIGNLRFFFKIVGWVEHDGTSAAGALVSNPKNERGVIKAFIVSNRPCLGT
jgi:hypothetical protein